MGKRKIFTKTNLNVPQVEHSQDMEGNVVILPDVIPPINTKIAFGRNATTARTFDFARWYGADIDPITYACQRQIERFLSEGNAVVATSSVSTYCRQGLRFFLDYCLLQAKAFGRELALADITRDLIAGYLVHLAGIGVATTYQKSTYAKTKSVLLALGRRGLVHLIISGDAATFPYNPFPNINRKAKGVMALSKREQGALTVALRQAIKPIWNDDVNITSELLSIILLLVALHTGRNTTPLLEMDRDCLQSHPKDNTVFLVLWKRRGYNSNKVALRAASDAVSLLKSTPSVRTNIERLIRRVMTLTEPLDAEAPVDLKGRVWLYRSRALRHAGEVHALTSASLREAANSLVARYNLTDSDGKPLRINISRLRKTFANRIFELTDGDLVATAAALGDTPRVADQNYLAPGEVARRNWQFMGEVLVQEMLTQNIGATYTHTPTGRCTDPVNGQYAPKREGATCMNFMNCLRCSHYAVTAEDLYKLFSFYFRVLTERSRMEKRRWEREYAHIPRLIDHYIIAEGLRRGTFNAAIVEAARERARSLPHPFWSVEMIDSLKVFA